MGLFGGLGKSKTARGIAGAVGDAFLMNNGRAPIWAPAMAEERKRQQKLEEQRAVIEPAVQALIARGVSPQEAAVIAQGGGADALLAGYNRPQEAPPMVRDTEAWQSMTPEQKQAYSEMMGERAGPSLIPLPGGKTFYGRPADIPTVLGQGGGGYGGGQPPVPPGRPTAQQQDPITAEMYRGAVNGLGDQGAADWIKRNGLVISVTTPQEARSLPSGTRIRLPDGTEGVVP